MVDKVLVEARKALGGNNNRISRGPTKPAHSRRLRNGRKGRRVSETTLTAHTNLEAKNKKSFILFLFAFRLLHIMIEVKEKSENSSRVCAALRFN